MAVQLVTDQLSTFLDGNYREQLVSNFEIIQSYLNKLDTNELDDMSDKLNLYETNMQSIVNILSEYDVPIAIVDGKVVKTEEGE